jgi:RHS repeat-associated protein
MPWLRHLACSIYFLAAFFEAAAARPMGLGPMQDERVASDARGTLLADRGVANLATPYGVRAQRLSQSAVLDYVERGYDADLGTVRFGVRDYDPLLGQFWSPDPLLLESLDPCAASPVQCNLYGYAKGNPISFHDPTGTFAWFVPLVVVALLEFEGAANAPGVDTPSEAILRSPSTGDLAISAAKMVVVGASAGAAAGWVAGAGAVAAGAAAGATGSVTARGWDDVSRGEFSGVGTYAKDSVFGAVFGGALGAVARGPNPRGSPVAEPPSGVVAAGGGPRLLSQFTKSTVDDVVGSAGRLSPGGQITEGARAIAKKLGHAQSGGYSSAFGGVKPNQANAEALIRSTLENPARTFYGDKVIDVYNAAGQGVRFDRATNAFRGFLEGGLATQ